MFAVLGTIEFDALGSPESIRRERAMHFAEHKVVEDVPRLQLLGPELDTVTLELKFHRAFTDPRRSRDAVYAAKDAGAAMPLVWGNGEHWGYFVIDRASDSLVHAADDGTPVSLTMQVTLREWSMTSDLDPLKPPKPGTPPLGIVGQLQPGQSVAGTVTVNPVTGAQVVTFDNPIQGASALANNPAGTGPSGSQLAYTDVSTGTIVRADVSAAGAQ